MDVYFAMEALRRKRSVFHSEADFQFAFAWELQLLYPAAEIRLEYPPAEAPKKYIDIFVRNEGYVYPIELKYPTNSLDTVVGSEKFSLKKGAGDFGRYDFINDICRLEILADCLENFKIGLAILLTNDQSFWKGLRRQDGGAIPFSVHDGAVKTGTMRWGDSIGLGSKKGGRDRSLILNGKYTINWVNYCDLGGLNGEFKYTIVTVSL